MSDPNLRTQQQILALQDALERLRKADAMLYATGSFTPTYYGSSVTGTTTYTLQYGTYRRIGSMVNIWLRVTWTNATGTGNALVGGLPFACLAGSHAALTVLPVNYTFAGSGLVAYIGGGNQYLELFTPTSGGVAAAAIDTAADLIISGSYPL